MNNVCKLHAIVVLLISGALGGCANRDKGDATKGEPNATTSPLSALPMPAPDDGDAACEVMVCSSYLKTPGFVPGRANGLPASFPAPPPSATVCGDMVTFHANYYSTTDSPSDLITYYEKTLTAAGYQVRPRMKGSKPCSLALSFERGAASGNVTARVGGYVILYSEK